MLREFTIRDISGNKTKVTVNLDNVAYFLPINNDMFPVSILDGDLANASKYAKYPSTRMQFVNQSSMLEIFETYDEVKKIFQNV